MPLQGRDYFENQRRGCLNINTRMYNVVSAAKPRAPRGVVAAISIGSPRGF
jgi:hypothetical protein